METVVVCADMDGYVAPAIEIGTSPRRPADRQRVWLPADLEL